MATFDLLIGSIVTVEVTVVGFTIESIAACAHSMLARGLFEEWECLESAAEVCGVLAHAVVNIVRESKGCPSESVCELSTLVVWTLQQSAVIHIFRITLKEQQSETNQPFRMLQRFYQLDSFPLGIRRVQP